MLKRLRTMLWGTISPEELRKFFFLALILSLIIGTYAMIRPLKDAVFMRIVGKYYLPYAKLLSFAFLIPLLMMYGKLVDLIAKHRVFYVVATIYVFVFLTIAYLLAHPVIGLANTLQSPNRFIGWSFYLIVESFSSIMVALFWSLAASTTDFASAKKGYPLIVAGAQIGAIIGPECAKNATYIGIANIVVIVSTILIVAIFLVKKIVQQSSIFNSPKPLHVTGPVEGLRLLFTHPYLIGIFCIATLHEIITILLEYRFLLLTDQAFISIEKVIEFLGLSTQITNTLALFIALFGTSFLLKTFDLTFCLVFFPVSAAIILLCIIFFPSHWSLLGALMIMKALGYALNNPCKEMLYIPTSVDIKFKAKSWIDAFGGRFSKALGALLNAVLSTTSALALYGSCAALGIVGVWTIVAMIMGKTHADLIKKNDTIS